jgi:Tfp pilus assembly protein PilZ
VPLSVKVQLFHKGVEIQAYSTDISTTGMFVETTRTLPVGSVVLLGFTLGAGARKTIQAEGRVAQVRTAEEAAALGGLPGMGVMFQGFLFGKADLAGELSKRLDALRNGRQEAVEDRVRHPRFLVGFPVLWGTRPPPLQIGFITDIGPDGAFIITDTPAVAGTHLYLSLEVPTSGLPQKVRALAQVTRANLPEQQSDDEPIGMGITFEEASLEDPSVLPFMQQHLARQRHSLLQESLEQQHGGDSDLPDLSSFLAEGSELEPQPGPEAPGVSAVSVAGVQEAAREELVPRIETAPELDLNEPPNEWLVAPRIESEPQVARPLRDAGIQADPSIGVPAAERRFPWADVPADSSVAWINPAAGALPGVLAADASLLAAVQAEAAELASVLVARPQPSGTKPADVPHRPVRAAPERTSSPGTRGRVGRWLAAAGGVALLLFVALYFLGWLRP